MREIWIIYHKELREVVRDRKTLIFMIALPMLLIPAILELALDFAIDAETQARVQTLRFAVFDDQHLPELASALRPEDGFEAVDLADRDAIADAIRRGDIALALVVSPPTGGQDRAGPQHRVTFYYDNASVTSQVKQRVSAAIRTVSEQQRAARLNALGVPTSAQARLLEPVVIDERGLADMRAVLGEQIGGMLPYILILFCFWGALYPAIDLGAGEKERGTLETLLLVPVARWRLVIGKFLVIFTAGTTSAALSLLSLGVWLGLKAREFEGLLGLILQSVGTLDLLLIAAMLVPTAAMFAALLLSISIYATSFKEAQSYTTPINLLVILPAVFAMLPGVELNWHWAMVPITNIALAIKELVKGTMDYGMLVVILASSAIIAGALLGFCAWWFHRERVLFRN